MAENGVDLSYLPGSMQLAINIGLAIATILASLWGFTRKREEDKKEDDSISLSRAELLALLVSIDHSNGEILKLMQEEFMQQSVDRRARELVREIAAKTKLPIDNSAI